jgi:hypothetical protein
MRENRERHFEISRPSFFDGICIWRVWRANTRFALTRNRLYVYPLTAPAVRPEIMRFWKISTRIISGTVTITEPAMIGPQGTS